ncbi:acyl-homoserine-lactone synthase [Mesorhizobium sp. LNHC221B00]|uniref:acyl-homoserine-lactone synthase n=1 Tax=Mesorhizobium sp. LNHC221B00 TaxID=1287233 RepID=UPI00068532FE|nr:acyl-homoserine-lactone synthase [Mesorhizobium sp. LNHC221B00]
MRRLRFGVFKERLDWDVRVYGGYEVVFVYALIPHYLLLLGFEGRVRRLRPPSAPAGPAMLPGSFPVLLEGRLHLRIRASGKAASFALDIASSAKKGSGRIALGNYGLFEFGLSRRLSHP